ncbi:MAG: hypothetical protein H6730_35365 [Deltaproteobacteria bacterium]|nr:hypothetical protein [Deltaproteobacteria bacterium]
MSRSYRVQGPGSTPISQNTSAGDASAPTAPAGPTDAFARGGSGQQLGPAGAPAGAVPMLALRAGASPLIPASRFGAVQYDLRNADHGLRYLKEKVLTWAPKPPPAPAEPRPAPAPGSLAEAASRLSPEARASILALLGDNLAEATKEGVVALQARFEALFEGPLAPLLVVPLQGEVPRDLAMGLEAELTAIGEALQALKFPYRIDASITRNALLRYRTPDLDVPAMSQKRFAALPEHERMRVFENPEVYDCKLMDYDGAAAQARARKLLGAAGLERLTAELWEAAEDGNADGIELHGEPGFIVETLQHAGKTLGHRITGHLEVDYGGDFWRDLYTTPKGEIFSSDWR